VGDELQDRELDCVAVIDGVPLCVGVILCVAESDSVCDVEGDSDTVWLAVCEAVCVSDWV